MTAAQSFKADARYAKATEIVALNPEDQAGDRVLAGPES